MTCSVLLSLNWLTVKDSVIGIKKLLAWGSHAGFSQKNECHEKKNIEPCIKELAGVACA